MLLNKDAAVRSELVRWRAAHLLQVGAGSAITKSCWLHRGVRGVGRVLVEHLYLLVVGGAASVDGALELLGVFLCHLLNRQSVDTTFLNGRRLHLTLAKLLLVRLILQLLLSAEDGATGSRLAALRNL